MTIQLPAKIRTHAPEYSAGRRALAEARHILEVKPIRDKALAMEVYAFQAKDAQLAADAVEIRKLAERRIGQLMAEGPKAKPPGGSKARPRKDRGRNGPDPLEAQGIDKHLAKRARKAAAKTEREFDEEIKDAKRLAVAAIDGDKPLLAAARMRRQEEAKQRQRSKATALAQKMAALPSKRFGVFYADPPWKYEHPAMGATTRSIENHYPTMTLEQICALPVRQIVADDALLLLWATAPKLPECLKVMEAWGFTYRTQGVWDKEIIGMGYWFRNQHEILLLGTRGNFPAPEPGLQPSSVLRERRGKHSAKPTYYRDLLDRWFPELEKLEMFARSMKPRDNWTFWGNEA